MLFIRKIENTTLQAIANALRGRQSQGDADKIEVDDFATVAQDRTDSLKGTIDRTATSVTIPSGVTSIGTSAFYGCSNLASVTIPSSATSIGYASFQDCIKLKNVTILNGVTSIGGNAFFNCSNLESITIPSGVTSIGSKAFGNCSNLRTINLPSTITTMDGRPADCFSGINPNAVINCGFAQGAVSGAPWGAPAGVTINYGVTGGDSNE